MSRIGDGRHDRRCAWQAGAHGCARRCERGDSLAPQRIDRGDGDEARRRDVALGDGEIAVAELDQAAAQRGQRLIGIVCWLDRGPVPHRCRNPVRVGQGELQRPVAGGQIEVDVDAPFGRFLFQHPFEGLIPVAVEGRAFDEGLGQLVGENPPALHHIDAQALQLVAALFARG